MEFLKELRTELSCDPATSLLGTCLSDMSLREIPAPHVHCSLVHRRQAVEIMLSVSGQMNGYRKCHAKRKIIQP